MHLSMLKKRGNLKEYSSDKHFSDSGNTIVQDRV